MSTAKKQNSGEPLRGLKVRSLSVEKMESSCHEVSELLRALSHPQRLMVLGHLISGKKTVGELQELCALSQSQLSQFLQRLKAEGLVTSERDGKYQYYQMADQRVVQLLMGIQEIFCK